MQRILNRILDTLMSVIAAFFKVSETSQPLPPPLPLPPGVPLTPGPTPAGPAPKPSPTNEIAIRLTDFVHHFEGRFIEKLGPGAKFQCVDLCNGWLQKMGLRLFPGDAASWEFDSHPDCFFIRNTPANIPNPGDIVVWGRSPNLPWGHVGIFFHGGVMSFVSFDQNWPIGSPSHQQGHSYVGIRGWLSPLVNRIRWVP